MTLFSPCRLCPHKSNCLTLAEAKQATKGLNITAAHMSCGTYSKAFIPGDRVHVSLGRGEQVMGTVVGKSSRKKYRFVVEIDSAYYDILGREAFREPDHAFITTQPDRMVKADERRREMCPTCGASLTGDGKHESYLQWRRCESYR